jgi:hypothetical protein
MKGTAVPLLVGASAELAFALEPLMARIGAPAFAAVPFWAESPIVTPALASAPAIREELLLAAPAIPEELLLTPAPPLRQHRWRRIGSRFQNVCEVLFIKHEDYVVFSICFGLLCICNSWLRMKFRGPLDPSTVKKKDWM